VLDNNPYLDRAVHEGELPWLPGKPTRDAFDHEIGEIRRRSTELEFDRRMWHRGRDFIGENPAVAARLAWAKIKFLWRPAPWHTSVEGTVPLGIRLSLGAFSIFLYVAAFTGLIFLRHRPLTLTLAIFPPVLFTLVHALVWSQVRFRIPLHPLLAALAAAGLGAAAARIAGRETPCAE